MQVQIDVLGVGLVQEGDQIGEAPAKAVNAPSHDLLELAAGDPLQQSVVCRSLVTTLGAADAFVGVNGGDDPALTVGNSVQFLKLVLDGLGVRGHAGIDGDTLGQAVLRGSLAGRSGCHGSAGRQRVGDGDELELVMAEHPRSSLIFSDLMAAVGEVMLRWGYLEVEMLNKLAQSGYGPIPRAAPLQQWRIVSARSASDVSAWTEEIERVAQIRNLLAHGLIGGHAQPAVGDPGIVCRDMDGGHHAISYDTLIDTAKILDIVRHRLRREPDDLLTVPPNT